LMVIGYDGTYISERPRRLRAHLEG
jgi:hypothetical protein